MENEKFSFNSFKCNSIIKESYDSELIMKDNPWKDLVSSIEQLLSNTSNYWLMCVYAFRSVIQWNEYIELVRLTNEFYS